MLAFAPPVVTLPLRGSAPGPLSRGVGFPVRRVYCIGQNYVAHQVEMGNTDRKPPFFFHKPTDAVLAAANNFDRVAVDASVVPTLRVPYPPMTKDYHFECELVVAVGPRGQDATPFPPQRDIPTPEAALALVCAYGVGFDMTRRDLQAQSKKSGRPWEIGKAFDHAAPTGPLVTVRPGAGWATADGFVPTTGKLELSVNGVVRQTADLRDMVWSLAEQLQILSRYQAIVPGDVVFSGTPAGVGAVVPGDVLLGSVEGLAAVRLEVTAAEGKSKL